MERKRKLIMYRVRHPACPDLFVWHLIPISDTGEDSDMRVASFNLSFAKYRGGMSLKDAKELAKRCGGSIEKVVI